MNTNCSFRKKENPFSQVSNAVLRDNSISLETKGLFCIMQSLTQSELPCNIESIKKYCPDKDVVIEKALDEFNTLHISCESEVR